ncbi:glutamate-rich protein 1 isoform X2 [Epinephelus moara]|uniref:glutamate-rich protein 1 isoform X2 n=1 Tax=Epinephelus moara TaxID=300413 RepID=UPI00214E876E|nr:glutamate-rich protein 1 isoform X2 [Epinephelus moara]
MARREEVFQSKVLQKLYPAAPKLEKQPSPPRIVDALSKKTYVKRKASQQDTVIDTGTQSAATPGRRMYTVLPPPTDYKTDSEKSVTLPQFESINSAEDPAEVVHDSDKDQDKEEEEQKRKRRRRKRKTALHQDSEKDGAAPLSESSTGHTPVDEGGERVSRNKKRKLKKKRHKEKLLSMGLMPRATALEFTYRKDGEEEEEEEEEEGRAVDVSDFLRTTLEIYLSDSSMRGDKLPLLSGTVNDLLSSISSGSKHTSVLKQLHSLKALVQQQEANKLEMALEEFSNTSPMSAEETTAVIALFQYWITDIFPMQGDKKTGFSTTHP